MSAKWVEISNTPDELRYRALSRAMMDAGFANEVEFVTTDVAGLGTSLEEAKGKFAQIRIGGALCETALSLVENLPSRLLTLKVADAFQHDRLSGKWWPRNFLSQGLSRALVSDVIGLDFTGAAFVLGAGCEARVAIGSLAQLGFHRFAIASSIDAQAKALIEDVRKTHFGVQFQLVARQQITQLPSVHSVAVNTLALGQDDGTHRELFYFNFLQPGGLWVDLALHPPVAELEGEARAVGAKIEPGLRVAVWTDVAWAHEVFGIDLDPAKLTDLYAQAFS